MYTGSGYAAPYNGTATVTNSMYTTSDVHGSAITNSFSNASHNAYRLSDTSALLVYAYPSASGSKTFATIVTVASNNPNSILHTTVYTLFNGVAVNMGGTATGKSNSRYVLMAGTTKALIWGIEVSTGKLIAHAITISGTTITLGAATYISATSAAFNSSEASAEVCDISNGAGTKYAVMYRSASSTNTLAAFTVSGTTITLGSSIAAPNVFTGGGSSMCALGVDKAIIYTMGGTNNIGQTVVTVSGTTCTLGTNVSATGVTISAYTESLTAIQTGTDKAVCMYMAGGSVQYGVSTTVSGTVPTGAVFGTVANGGSPSGGAQMYCYLGSFTVGTDTFCVYALPILVNTNVPAMSCTIWKVGSSGAITDVSGASTLVQATGSSGVISNHNSISFTYDDTSGDLIFYFTAESGGIYAVAANFDSSAPSVKNMVNVYQGTSQPTFLSQCKLADSAQIGCTAVKLNSDCTIVMYYNGTTSQRPFVGCHRHSTYVNDMQFGTVGGSLAGMYSSSGIQVRGLYTFNTPPTTSTGASVTVGGVVYADLATGAFTNTVSTNLKLGRYIGNNIFIINENIITN
jgi:hypothetical protein